MVLRLSGRVLAGLAIVGLALSVPANVARAEDYTTVWIEPGKTEDVYWSINLSGKVYLTADVDGQPACLEYWWIVWPFTQIKKLGQVCGRATFDLPGLSDFAIGGKLRAGGASARTRLRGTSDERVAHHLPELKF